MEEVSGPRRSATAGLHRRDLGEDQHGADPGLGAARPEIAGPGSEWPLEDADPDRCVALRPDRCAVRVRQPYQRAKLRSLCRAGSRADACARRPGSHKGQPVRAAIRRAGARLFFLPPTVPISTPSNRLSPSSNSSCVLPQNEPSTQRGKPQEDSSNDSSQTNAATTSSTQDTLQHEIIRL